MELTLAKVADPQMHHPRRRRGEHDAIREIGVLRNDDQFVGPGVLPNGGVRNGLTQRGRELNRKVWNNRQLARKILVKDEALHATLSTLN